VEAMDTGASICCISPRLARKFNVYANPNSHIQPLFAADGENLNVLGSVVLIITLGNFNVQHEFHIVENLGHQVLLGMDFLQKTCCYINLSSNYVSFYDGRIFLPLQTLHENSVILRATEFVIIPAKSQAFIPVKMAENALSNFQTSAIVEPHVKLTLNKVSVKRMLVNKSPTGRLNRRVFNYDTQPKNIFRGISVAVITPLSEGCGINHAHINSCKANTRSKADSKAAANIRRKKIAKRQLILRRRIATVIAHRSKIKTYTPQTGRRLLVAKIKTCSH